VSSACFEKSWMSSNPTRRCFGQRGVVERSARQGADVRQKSGGCAKSTGEPHDLRRGVAMQVLEQHHDLEEVRALLGHARIDTTQIYTSIKPSQLKRAVSFYETRRQRC
jgi:site-specific recombinase XerD